MDSLKIKRKITAIIMPFNVIQGRWCRCNSKARVWIPVWSHTRA